MPYHGASLKSRIMAPGEAHNGAPGEAQPNQVSGEMQGSLQGKLGSRLAEKQIGNLSFPRGSEVGEQVCTEVFGRF